VDTCKGTEVRMGVISTQNILKMKKHRSLCFILSHLTSIYIRNTGILIWKLHTVYTGLHFILSERIQNTWNECSEFQSDSKCQNFNKSIVDTVKLETRQLLTIFEFVDFYSFLSVLFYDSSGSSVNIVTRLRAVRPEFDSWQR